MNYQGICKVIGNYFFLLAFFLAVGWAVSFYYAHKALPYTQTDTGPAFALTLCLTLLLGIVLKNFSKKSDQPLFLREAIVSVLSIWIITVVITALPFILSGTFTNFFDALFESTSGLTTTGASIAHAKTYNQSGQEIPITKVFHGFQEIKYTFYGTVKPVRDPLSGEIVLSGVEAIPQALLFWRSFLQFIGGLGMVLLFIALLPALGHQGRILFRYEATGPSFSPLFPQVRKTAIVLISIYLLLNAACIISLMFTNDTLSLMEAFNISSCAIATGGFSTKNASIAGYHNVWTEIVAMVFMILGATNFALYYDIYKGRLGRLLQPEVVVFLSILLGSSVIVSVDITGSQIQSLTNSAPNASYTFLEALRYGSFQVISAMTTTGFATANYDQWPPLSQSIMLILMYLGGMAGSTAGGFKIIRLCILLACFKSTIQSIFDRNEVRIIRVGKREITAETINGVLCFLLILLFSSLVGILLLVTLEVDLETAFGLNACMINNSGAAFRMAGPLESCAFLSNASKVICMIWMLLGRLEFYIWFTLFLPSFWRIR